MAELSTLARPYARAAFEYADANSALDAWLDQLAAALGLEQALARELEGQILLANNH